LASAIGRAYPHTDVTGIDISCDRFAEHLATLPSNVHLQANDARALPFDESTFDLAYCRFLLEYVREKQGVVNEMVRVCKPGAELVLQDLDGQLIWHHPEDSDLQAQICAVMSVLSETGFDPLVGRKLFFLAKVAGLSAIDVQVEAYHLYAGAIDDRNLALWETKLDIALPAASKALGGDAAARTLKRRFLDYLRRDETLSYSVLFTVTGRKHS
jgi:SAM-dependent methyltransferase